MLTDSKWWNQPISKLVTKPLKYWTLWLQKFMSDGCICVKRETLIFKANTYKKSEQIC